MKISAITAEGIITMYEKIVLAKYASLEFQLIIETNNIGDIDQCPGSANCALPSAHMTHAAFS